MLPNHENNSHIMNLICPSCEKVNNPDAVFCAHCGYAFSDKSNTTVIVPNKSYKVPDASQLSHLIDLHPDALILYIVGRKQPMIVKTNADIVLGRHGKDDTEDKPDVDFTDFDGHILGVSRKHAIIHLTDDGYSIEDLGSSNGTFVNEQRIQPNTRREVASGDLLRIGQCILYIYFNKATKPQSQPRRSASISQHELLLLERSDTTDLANADGVPVNYLYTRILPFLKALQEVQTMVDEFLGRDNSRMDIRTININKNRDGVEIKLISYPEMVQQVADTVTSWKQTHNRNDLIDEELYDLIIYILDKALPESETQQRDILMERMLPYIRVICSSSLDLSRS